MICSVELPDPPVMVAGVKFETAPVGKPLTASPTVPVKLFWGVTETV